MAQDYNQYLAAHVLNEQQYVTYRLLSRALKVHSNLAKQMLYEFHRKQNAKKPGSVHATYLITGIRRIDSPPSQANGVHKEEGEDIVMQSSPLLPSSSMPVPDETMEEPKLVRTILLVKEEDLEQAKNTFDTTSSIHIYSLAPTAVGDLQVLTECNRKVGAEFAMEDPLEAWRQYGTIQNPNVKRRKKGTAPPPPAPVVKPVEVKSKAVASAVKQEVKSEAKPSSNNATPEPEKKGIIKPTASKRQNSDIFKSFSKAKTKPKADSQSSAEASPVPKQEDEAMTGFSDDEGLDDDETVQEEAKALNGKSKNEREVELKAMMDAEDEEMEDAPTPAAESQDQEPEHAIDKTELPKSEEPNESVTVENGRRRGRRRVMKKKTVKDEEGYLVTREEAAWESFSEEEPAPKKIKVASASSLNVSGKTAAKKGSGGKPKGNIMSFFGKK